MVIVFRPCDCLLTYTAYIHLSQQSGACENARQTQGSRGHARRDGPDPHRHLGGRPASTRAVETETLEVVQCEEQKTQVLIANLEISPCKGFLFRMQNLFKWDSRHVCLH